MDRAKPTPKSLVELVGQCVTTVARPRLSPPLVAVFDIDETLVSTHPGFNVEAAGDLPTDAQLRRMSAHVTPGIVAARNLFKYLQHTGVHVVCVTARADTPPIRRFTAAQLRAVGLPLPRQLFLCPVAERGTAESIAAFKHRARAAAARAVRGAVIVSVGDQWYDLTPDARAPAGGRWVRTSDGLLVVNSDVYAYAPIGMLLVKLGGR